MSPKHEPTVVWLARPLGSYPQVWVSTADENNIRLVFQVDDGEPPRKIRQQIVLPRRLARMVAKRINQCLDETK